MPPDVRKFIPLLLVAIIAAVLAGCGGSGSSSSGSSASTEATSTEEGGGESVLGEPNKATGKPIVFGQINMEIGPITWPNRGQSADAAVEYVNNYLGGIHGRPIKIERCATDGQPATSARCANQIIEKDPVAILGAADLGAAGSMPVFEQAGLAYLGGSPFTPIESNAKNAAIFMSLVVGDNSALAGYAKEPLGLKSSVVLDVSNTTSKLVGAVIMNSLEGAGLSAKEITAPETASDFSAQAAEAVSSGSELVFVEIPTSCAAMLKALKAVGNTATVMAIDLCTSPVTIEAAGDAAEGIYAAGPFEGLDSGSEEMEITLAALSKYAPADISIEANALDSFGTVMNVYRKLNEAPESVLEEPSKILGLFEEGKENPNWLAHPYTCNHEQVPGQAAVCNGYQKIKQVKDGKEVVISKGWVNGTQYFDPSKLPQ